jgi:hypothetical protein
LLRLLRYAAANWCNTLSGRRGLHVGGVGRGWCSAIDELGQETLSSRQQFRKSSRQQFGADEQASINRKVTIFEGR